MTHVQRSLILVILIGLFFGGAFFLSRETSKKRVEQWQMLRMERFINQLGKTGRCSYENILELSQTLNYYGVSSEISLEEYRREDSETKSNAYYLISWSEISEQLLNETYCFAEKSVIRANIRVTDKYHTKAYQYYAVAEKEGK